MATQFLGASYAPCLIDRNELIRALCLLTFGIRARFLFLIIPQKCHNKSLMSKLFSHSKEIYYKRINLLNCKVIVLIVKLAGKPIKLPENHLESSINVRREKLSF